MSEKIKIDWKDKNQNEIKIIAGKNEYEFE